MTKHEDTHPESRTVGGRRLAVLGAVCLAATILPLSFSGGAIATPAIGRDLGGSPAALTWITNAFMLTFGSLLMVAGALADRSGRKRLFMLGVGLFALVSLALSLAPSVLVIDLLRAAQGVGAAAALAGGTAALAQEFEGTSRMRAFSLLGTTFGTGLAFGPLLAGALIDSVSWRAVFLLTAIVGLVALLLAARVMRETRAPAGAGFDWTGAALFTGLLSLLTFGVIEAPADGWGSAAVLGALIGALILAVAFAMVELRSGHPMLDVTLFRHRRFLGVQMLPVATCCSYVVLLVLLPLRFIGIEGRSEIAAGLSMLALSAPMLVVPSIAARLTRWISPGAISAVGLLIAAGGLLLLGRAGPGTGVSPIPAMLLIGAGSGFPWGLMDGLSVSVVPVERAGMASGIFSTIRVAGEGVALAVVSALLAFLVRAGLGDLASASLQEAAQHLATGDLSRAATLLPGLSRPELVRHYAEACRELCYLLAAITASSAVAVFATMLGDGAPKGAGHLASTEPD